MNSKIELDFDDVLIVPARGSVNSRLEVQLDVEKTFPISGAKWKGIPVVAANLDTLGTPKVAEQLSRFHMSTCISKFTPSSYWDEPIIFEDDFLNWHWIGTGINNNDAIELDRIISHIQELFYNKPIYSISVPIICVDVANGYTDSFIQFLFDLRKKYRRYITIIAGNIATPDVIEELHDVVDAFKIGIGPGALCQTRTQTGVGYPQLSAIIECSEFIEGRGYKNLLIADGGCKNPGDIAKAFVAGADFVMVGSLLSGHDENGGQLDTDTDGKQYMIIYGMSSRMAIEKYSGGLKDYRSSEGRVVRIPYKGPIANTVNDILGGLRSSCAYVGAYSLLELPIKGNFVRVTNTHNRIFESYEIGGYT